MDFKEPITIKGKEKIDKELEQLIKVDREDIKQKIQEARELGDLKENAEYHSAKEKQALIEDVLDTFKELSLIATLLIQKR